MLVPCWWAGSPRSIACVACACRYQTIFFPLAETDFVCLPNPWPQITEYWRSYDSHLLCNTVPYGILARGCNLGVWHGFYEYGFASDFNDLDGNLRSDHSREWMFPCDELEKYSSYCYYNFLTYLSFGDWRMEKLVEYSYQPKGLLTMCSEGPKPKVNELNVQGCIFAVSAVWWPLFDKIAAARTAADLETPPLRARCQNPLWGATDLNSFDLNQFEPVEYYNVSTYGPPKVHCDLLYNSRLIPPTHIENTLIAWCELFVSDSSKSSGEVSALDWQRWKAVSLAARSAVYETCSRVCTIPSYRFCCTHYSEHDLFCGSAYTESMAVPPQACGW